MISELVYGWKLNQITCLIISAESVVNNNNILVKLRSKLERMHGHMPKHLEARIKTLFNI